MDTLKKGLIISCVSALFIVVSKYLYQKYIQFASVLREQNVKIFSMEKRIEKLETDYVATVTPMMGGIQIPVQFRAVEKPIKPRDAKVIQFEHATPETVETIETGAAERQAQEMIRAAENAFENQTCELDGAGEPLTVETLRATQTNTLTELLKDEILDDVASFTSENLDGVKRRRGGRTRTKRPFANAKDYQNGDRITEEGIEYVCIVGRKGGHSWKRVDETINDVDSVDTNGTV